MIRAEHVARLLSPGEGERVLIVYEGRAEVVDEGKLGDPGYEGALRVVNRAELAAERGGDPSNEEIEAIAQWLNTAVDRLGG